MEGLDPRRARAARNQSLFREVNERIADLTRRYADELLPNRYICECLNTDCTATLELTHDEYERLRADGARFFVLPGHQDSSVETVVEGTPRYVIVEKVGAGAEVAETLNPRKLDNAA